MGPGAAFLEALRDGLGGLPLIAEDLGEITPEVEALRDRFDLPGMRVLQFALRRRPAAPSSTCRTRYINHCIAYTGTHDNDTTVGWFHAAHAESDAADRAGRQAERAFALRVTSGPTATEFHWDLIRVGPGLGRRHGDHPAAGRPRARQPRADERARPRRRATGPGGSCAGQIDPSVRDRLADMTAVYSRWNGVPPAPYGPPRPPESQATETTKAPGSDLAEPRADGPPATGKRGKKAAVEGPKTRAR